MSRSHADLDRRSLALHRLVADKIRRDPALFEQGRQTLAHWRRVVCPAAQPWREAWQQLFDQGREPCLEVATEDSERAAALRQSSPFAGILSHRECFEPRNLS